MADGKTNPFTGGSSGTKPRDLTNQPVPARRAYDGGDRNPGSVPPGGLYPFSPTTDSPSIPGNPTGGPLESRKSFRVGGG